MRDRFSDAIQDYLKEIYKLLAAGRRATTSAVATEMGVSAPSATGMLKKLAALGLVEHEPYRGATLTSSGERVAVEIVRHHRLLEMYLAATLGVAIEDVHAEADRLEHALSEELEARIDEALGYPTHDPHGHPIPNAALELPAHELRPLVELVPGEAATIRHVPDADERVLRYLSELELVPGRRIELRHAAPLGGPITVLTAGAEHAISRELAAQIGVA
jgi:DtxR family Mn-dependent transcriptional regulator